MFRRIVERLLGVNREPEIDTWNYRPTPEQIQLSPKNERLETRFAYAKTIDGIYREDMASSPAWPDAKWVVIIHSGKVSKAFRVMFESPEVQNASHCRC